jgi:hypothetical protein
MQQPWEIGRLDVAYPIRFYGHVENVANSDRAIWSGGMECLAVAYDTPIPGYGTKNCANIRLWSAKPVQGFDLNSFNAGNYEASVHASSEVGNIVSTVIGKLKVDPSPLPQRQHVCGQAAPSPATVPLDFCFASGHSAQIHQARVALGPAAGIRLYPKYVFA